jgi:small subunit ribosomal protein S34
VEKVFRGKKFEKPICIEKSSKTPDFKLLSKKEEAEYCKIADREEKIIAPYMELPPLLREFIEKETGRKDIKMKVHHKDALFNNARLAKEGEKSNVEIAIGVGKPHPKAVGLYEGLSI